MPKAAASKLYSSSKSRGDLVKTGIARLHPRGFDSVRPGWCSRIYIICTWCYWKQVCKIKLKIGNKSLKLVKKKKKEFILSTSSTWSWEVLYQLGQYRCCSAPNSCLTLCDPLLFLPSIFPSIRVFLNELALCIRWPKYWSFNVKYQSFQWIIRVGFL